MVIGCGGWFGTGRLVVKTRLLIIPLIERHGSVTLPSRMDTAYPKMWCAELGET